MNLGSNSSRRLIFVMKNRGAGLVEVLVTMVVITIGLLGVAGLQMTAFNSSYGTLQRQVASMQVQDAVERLWAEACVLVKPPASNEPTVRGNIETAWNLSHPFSENSDYVAFPNRTGSIQWDGVVDFKGTVITTDDVITTLKYKITVTWTNDKIDKTGASGQSVSQTVQIPTLTCAS